MGHNKELISNFLPLRCVLCDRFSHIISKATGLPVQKSTPTLHNTEIVPVLRRHYPHDTDSRPRSPFGFQLFKLFKTHHRHNFTKPQTNSVTNDPIVSTIVGNSIFDQEFQLVIVVGLVTGCCNSY
jgi:hypothetical protein